MSLKVLAKNGLKWGIRNLPSILTGVGLAGIGLTAFFSGKGALEADKALKKYEEEQGYKVTDKKEKFKVTYKYYIPAVIAGLGSAASFIGANRVSAKQLAAAVTAAKTIEGILKENRDTVKELYGDKGLRKVDEKINEKHADEYIHNAKSNTEIFETGHGSTLCCEGFLTGMLFHASPEWIHRCVNEFNRRLIDGENLCYNEFITMLVPDFDIDRLPDVGDKFCYNLDIRRHMLEVVEDSGLLKDTREPYILINLREMPLLDHTAYYQDHLAYA